MSITVRNLTKVYGNQKALDNVSFDAKKGEILGFLGPNGAGKSTTMKIMTGFISATSGQVSIANHDVTTDLISAQRSIGYLPEHNPLYLDMYVHEFLTFSCRSYGMPKTTTKTRVSDVIALCGLNIEQNKQIGQLSKGYRQRVGLAQALLHEPEVLILDEPTTGLDPNQILEIRKLIKDVAKDRTVIFSSHIMQEVKALCDRVIVINKGQIVTDQSIEGFSSTLSDDISLKIEFTSDIDLQLLDDLNTIKSVEHISEGKYKVAVEASESARSEIFTMAAKEKLPLVGLQEETSSLEDVFHELTKDN